MSKITARFFGAIMYVTLCLIAFEAALRIYDYFRPSFIFPKSGYSRYRPQPYGEGLDGFQYNSKGFNDREYAYRKQGNIYRIVVLGDSFAFGSVPYKDNFLTRLESKLNETGALAPRDVEIINMGIPCLGPKEYYELLVNEGVHYSPDMVLCCFFMGNDFIDHLKSPVRTSYLGSAFRYLRIVLSDKTLPAKRPGERKYNIKSMSDAKYMKIELNRAKIFVKGNVGILRRYGAVTYSLCAMRDICAKKKIDFRVIILPEVLQVEPDLMNSVISGLKVPESRFDKERPNKLLHRFLTRAGIRHVDLLPDFTGDERLYIPNNTHWNARGNELAADLIYDKLTGQGFNGRQ